MPLADPSASVSGPVGLGEHLQSGLHHSALATGLMLLPWTGVTMFVTPLAGALVDPAVSVIAERVGSSLWEPAPSSDVVVLVGRGHGGEAGPRDRPR
ncbi:MAG: hypothetical protein DLM54_09320 [Acidimicrobiales bacterium]|nr:MAG: hypothetical protein DLM54_09320 [Acidimicrobiales bacterium]